MSGSFEENTANLRGVLKNFGAAEDFPKKVPRTLVFPMTANNQSRTRMNINSQAQFTLALLFCVAPLTSHAQTTAFTYQGRLTDNGGLPNGNYDMYFSVFATHSGGTTLGAVTNRPVAVTNGLFVVTLDFGSGVFTGPPRWLEMGVRTNGSAGLYTALLPRQQITATPYAIFAGIAGNVSGGAISNAQIASGQVVKSLNGLKDNVTLAAGANVSLVTNGNTLHINSSGSGAFSLNGTNAFYKAGNVGIGTASPTDILQIDPNGFGGILVGGPEPGRTYMDLRVTAASGGYGRIQSVRSSGTAWGDISLNPFGGYVGIGTTTPHAKLELQSGFGTEVLRFGYSDNEYHAISTWYSGVPRLNSLTFKLGNGPGATRNVMTLRGDGSVDIPSGFGTEVIRFPYSDTEYHAISTWYSSVAGLNSLTFKLGDGTGATTPAMSVRGDGSAIIQASNNGDGAVLELRNNASGLNENLGTINFTTSDGSSKGKISCFVDGGFTFTGGTVSVPVLQINGADVAEPFEISTKDLPKGSVVTIDEDHPGQLKRSDQAYDKRVAGILSGANGVRTGIRLKQEGFNDHGEEVALSGRVYAFADASDTPIKPGDLLTTSATPGHCMKARDHARAQGAIIGKAMSALKEGKGMVLVLVSLQ